MSGVALRLLWPTGPGAFRLWLALVVVVHHFTRVEFGKAPVLVFFALSGFWVHQAWRSRYAEARQPYLTFMISRWWRIAPVLLVATAVTLATLAALGHRDYLDEVLAAPGRQLSSAVFVLGNGQMEVRPVGPAWSLDVEAQFYAVAPLLILLMQRLSWLATLALTLMVQVVCLMAVPGTFVTSYLAFFVIGMIAAAREWRAPPGLAFWGLVAAVAAVVIGLVSPWDQLLLGAGSNHAKLFSILPACLALPFALYTVRQPGDRADARLADHSYSIYLLHWPAILIFRDLPADGSIYALVWAIALSGGVIAISWLVLTVVDRPLQALRSEWVKAQRTDLLPSRTLQVNGFVTRARYGCWQ